MSFPSEDTVGPFSVALRNKLTVVRQFFEEKHRCVCMVFSQIVFFLQSDNPLYQYRNVLPLGGRCGVITDCFEIELGVVRQFFGERREAKL